MYACIIFLLQVRRDNCPLVANLVNTCLRKILIDRCVCVCVSLCASVCLCVCLCMSVSVDVHMHARACVCVLSLMERFEGHHFNGCMYINGDLT